MNSPQSLELHIDELILHGFAPSDRVDIRDAVQRELARLLTEQGVPRGLAQDGEISSLDGGSFDVAPGSRAESIGAQVAQAVYGGLER